MKKLALLIPLFTSLAVIGCSSNNDQSISTTETSSNVVTSRSDLVIKKKDVEGEYGTYDYSLRIRPDLTLEFDIDLASVYQDIDGDYNLHYEIDKEKNHIMVVSGKFDNVIVSSPLIEQIHPEMVTRLVKTAESLGFFIPDENNSYEWIEDICNDPQNWIQTNISEDSYSYKLDLKTDEGFSFVNALSLLIFEEQHGYSIDFHYSLPTSENEA